MKYVLSKEEMLLFEELKKSRDSMKEWALKEVIHNFSEKYFELARIIFFGTLAAGCLLVVVSGALGYLLCYIGG